MFCDSTSCMQALEEATAVVRLQPSNAVQQVAIADASIPINPVPAGTAPSVAVQLATEDGKPVDYQDALHALQLCIIAPGGNSRHRTVRRAIRNRCLHAHPNICALHRHK